MKKFSTFFRMWAFYEISSQLIVDDSAQLTVGFCSFISELEGHLGTSGFEHIFFLCKVEDVQ